MRHALLISTAAILGLSAGPAAAELRDVIAETDGTTGRIWLAFDAQPATVDVESDGAALDLRIGGVSSADRLISPSDRSLVDAIRVSAGSDGAVTVRLQGHGGWQDAHAEVRRGGVLVTLDLGEAVTLARAGSPDRASVQEPREAGASDTGRPSGAGPDTGADPHEREAPSRQSAGQDTAPDGGETGQSQAGEQEAGTAATESRSETAADESGASETAAAANAGGDCAEEAAAVAENPWDDDSLHRHAACLTAAGELDAAAIIYEQMLAFAPDDFRALIALAEVRAEQGENAAARELYSQAASFAISDAEAARARARLRELQQR
ncbi:MAG: hypothetical protein U9P68_08690 [Pseudomonadota bacterium]|nr:hypothetical protein [Pseudomonadota bacterium]